MPLKYKACKGQDWVGQGPMVALAAAYLEHIVPDVTHLTKWETTASRIYVPMGSPGPAISTNPPELSMEVPAAPNQSAITHDVAGYHLMRALFPPEIHEPLQNIVNPDWQTLEEWPVHGAGYPGLRLQTQRDTVAWFPLPPQNALYNAIYGQWIFLKDSDTLGMVLHTRPEDTNTEDYEGCELLHRMHHWSRAYAHLTHTVIVPFVEAAQALQVQVGSHCGTDGVDDVPNSATPSVHQWRVPAVNNERVPRLNLHMGTFAFVPAARGFTKQPTLEAMVFSQMAHYWGALTPVDNLRNTAQWNVNIWVCNYQYQVCTYRLPCFGRRHSLFWRTSKCDLTHAKACFSASRSVL